MSVEPLCPECLGVLTSSDGVTARCPLHGGHYQVLFARAPVWSTGSGAAGSSAGQLPAGVVSEPAIPASLPPLADYGRCIGHPQVAAVALCRTCGSPVCGTCVFVFPGDVRLCPRCATEPRKELTPRRKKSLRWAYVLAVVATLGMVGMFAASSAASTKQEEALAGVLGSLFVMVPGLIGTAMAFSAYDRRLANPPSVWAALIWNGLILGVFVLLAVVGTFMP